MVIEGNIKKAVVHLKMREREETSFYSGLERVKYVQKNLPIEGRRIHKMYYNTDEHRAFVNRAYSKLHEKEDRSWEYVFTFLLGLRQDDFVMLKGIFNDGKQVKDMMDLMIMDMEAQ